MTSSLSFEDKLKRMIYLNHIDPHFYIGDPDKYQLDMSLSRHDTMCQIIESDLREFFFVLDIANKDVNLPRRSIIFFILGKLIGTPELKPEQNQKISAKITELIQSSEDLFNFVKYYTKWKPASKIPSSVQKIIRRFYTNKTPNELANCVAEVQGMYKWSHKDLIKLAHFKSDSPLKNTVINYILTGKSSDKASEEELKVLDKIKSSDELRKTKESVDAVPILTTHKFSIHQVPSSLQQNFDVWSAAIQNMSISQILPYLLKLYKHSFLKSGSTISNYLLDLFTNPMQINNVYPMEVFIYMKRFEKGGKPMDVKLIQYLQEEKKLSEADLKKAQSRPEIKCPHIVNALNKGFDLACSNFVPTNKRYMVTIDVTAEAKRAHCIGSKFLSLQEAAVAFAIFLLRVEKDVIIATFKDDKIDLLSAGKKVSFMDLLKKVTEQKSAYSWLYSPVEWASSEKKHVDVFVNFIHNSYANKIPKEKNLTKAKYEPIVKYRSKVNLPNSKILNFAPAERNITLYGETPSNVLDILGFDTMACRVAECFFRGAFS
ncbi:RNA-binding protein RO60-like isoform X2 [Euwallacea similis]